MNQPAEWTQLAHFDGPPGGSSHKDLDVTWSTPNGPWGTGQQICFETGCCGCTTTITAAQFEELITAWQNRANLVNDQP